MQVLQGVNYIFIFSHKNALVCRGIRGSEGYPQVCPLHYFNVL